jgi:hypothetical protein
MSDLTNTLIAYDGLGSGDTISKSRHPLSPSPYTNSVVSDHLGYGSFSGADIKVVVHYPSTARAEQAIQEQKQILEARYSELTSTGTPWGDARNRNEQIAIENDLESFDDLLKELNNIPTSKVLGEIQTISYSSFREKVPVRTLGSVYPKAYVRGPRTIAGSMVFTIFHQHVLHEILKLNLGMFNTGTSDHDRFQYTTNLPDQLPPLDISLVFANEYGAVSHMGIWGVEFVQEGATFSIEDIFSENVVQYVARDLDPMHLVELREIDSKGVTEVWSKTASNLLYEKNSLTRHLTRRDPFI